MQSVSEKNFRNSNLGWVQKLIATVISEESALGDLLMSKMTTGYAIYKLQ